MLAEPHVGAPSGVSRAGRSGGSSNLVFALEIVVDVDIVLLVLFIAVIDLATVTTRARGTLLGCGLGHDAEAPRLVLFRGSGPGIRVDLGDNRSRGLSSSAYMPAVRGFWVLRDEPERADRRRQGGRLSDAAASGQTSERARTGMEEPASGQAWVSECECGCGAGPTAP
ncbi:hypothetical protein FRC08_006446 [Ceratobasidium sp. 394]|nr:hypothetical protein FRC08_006446 [Ceratobasidium sp. 394]